MLNTQCTFHFNSKCIYLLRQIRKYDQFNFFQIFIIFSLKCAFICSKTIKQLLNLQECDNAA